MEVRSESVVGIESPPLGNHLLGELRVDAPVPFLVGHRESVASHAAGQPQVVELLGDRSEARFDVPEALPKGQLGEGHGGELVPACEPPDPVVAAVALNQPAKRAPRKVVHELGEDELPLVHLPLPVEVAAAWAQGGRSSSRGHPHESISC